MKNKILLSGLIFFLGVSPSNADVFDHPQKLETVVQKLPPVGEVKCNFKQEKTMPGNVVLKSSGKFSFNKNSGAVFNTFYPVKSVSSYSSKDYRQINDIVDAVATRNYSKIENYFDFYFIDSKPWSLAMEPKPASKAAKYLKSIELSGTNRISKMTITNVNSVKTTIWFYD